jgi:hypothetical protein
MLKTWQDFWSSAVTGDFQVCLAQLIVCTGVGRIVRRHGMDNSKLAIPTCAHVDISNGDIVDDDDDGDQCGGLEDPSLFSSCVMVVVEIFELVER